MGWSSPTNTHTSKRILLAGKLIVTRWSGSTGQQNIEQKSAIPTAYRETNPVQIRDSLP